MILLIVTSVFAFSINGAIGTFASCVHGGTKYKDGDYFPSNDTIIKTEGPDQCVQCRCRRGLVVCEIENCPVLKCENPIQQTEFCCQRCPDAPKIQEKPSNLIFNQFSSELREKSVSGCLSNGKHYEENSVWQPVIGPFGTMACVQCRCLEGNVICSRLHCVDLPCLHPVREFGECCPYCPNSEIKEKKEVLCLPKTSELFVFKSTSQRNGSETIEYGFVGNKPNDTLAKIHTWKVEKEISSGGLSVKIISRNSFRKGKWQILGSTTKRKLKKYLKREKRLENHCSKKCLEKVKELVKSLEIETGVTRTKCGTNEIDTSKI